MYCQISIVDIQTYWWALSCQAFNVYWDISSEPGGLPESSEWNLESHVLLLTFGVLQNARLSFGSTTNRHLWSEKDVKNDFKHGLFVYRNGLFDFKLRLRLVDFKHGLFDF